MILKCMTNTCSAHLAKHTRSEQPIMTKYIQVQPMRKEKKKKGLLLFVPSNVNLCELFLSTETTKSLHSWILLSTAQSDLQT